MTYPQTTYQQSEQMSSEPFTLYPNVRAMLSPPFAQLPDAELEAAFESAFGEGVSPAEYEEFFGGLGRALGGAVKDVGRFGHVVTARVRRGDIPAVRGDQAVASMKAPKSVSPDLERGASLEGFGDADLTPHDQRRPDGLEQTGRGVVIGVLDWGCDFAHPDFRHPDGSTRLLALWDQRPRGPASDTTDAPPYGYGRIHGAAHINAALRTSDPYAALGYHPADADPGLGAHGTHTLGIAGGNGRGGGPPGVAPDAHLVFVHLGAREGPDAVPLGNSAELLEGLDLIARTAAGRPCAVNLSLGRHAGEKTGRSLVERALDEWVTLAPGRAVVQSCGNYFERRTHAALTLRPGETHTFTVRVDPEDRSPNELDLWYPGRDRLGVEVRSAGGDLVARASRGERAAASLDGREVLRVYHRAFDPNNGDHQINVQFEVVPEVHAWEVTLAARTCRTGGSTPGSSATAPAEAASRAFRAPRRTPAPPWAPSAPATAPWRWGPTTRTGKSGPWAGSPVPAPPATDAPSPT